MPDDVLRQMVRYKLILGLCVGLWGPLKIIICRFRRVLRVVCLFSRKARTESTHSMSYKCLLNPKRKKTKVCRNITHRFCTHWIERQKNDRIALLKVPSRANFYNHAHVRQRKRVVGIGGQRGDGGGGIPHPTTHFLFSNVRTFWDPYVLCSPLKH